jgi:DNA (cytosine-5)-methyltransferase 1
MPSAISLFSGAGGLDYGFEAAGFEIVLRVDADQDSCSSLRASRAGQVLQADVFDIDGPELLRRSGLARGEADALIAGPPCQPFSKSGYWWRGEALRLDDPRAGTLGRLLALAREILPRAIVVENVDALAFPRLREGLDLLLDGIAQINALEGTSYAPSWTVLDAASLGVPQHRRRFVLVAARDGQSFRFPSPTHGPDARAPYTTAWDALGANIKDASGFPTDPRGTWGALLPSIPEGSNYLWHTSRGGGTPLFGWRTRYWSFLLKLAKGRPSWTIQAQPGPATGPFHWDSRRLSPAEMMRLQTFPDDAIVAGDAGSVQRQIGNAVPSLLAEVLARSVMSQLLGARPRGRAPKLGIARRGDPPPPEPIKPVPRRYLPLRGGHADHPGPGLGPRAVRASTGRRTQST